MKLFLSLLLLVAVNFSHSSEVGKKIVLSPQWTERYLFKHYPFMLKGSHTDHVLAFYYFGSWQDFTVMGMERVKGDDYTPHYTVLIFKDSKLQGYYAEVPVFPAGLNEKGQVTFPKNAQVEDYVDLNEAEENYSTIRFIEKTVGYQSSQR